VPAAYSGKTITPGIYFQNELKSVFKMNVFIPQILMKREKKREKRREEKRKEKRKKRK